MMTDERWFHPKLSGLKAEELLQKKGIKGSFLIRPSQTNPDNLTLSVKQEIGVVHMRIIKSNNLYHLQNFTEEEFPTVNDLINHYTENPIRERNGPLIEILVPVFREEAITSLWYHGEMDQHTAETSLMTKGRKGSFLIRDSNDHKGYVLSVRLTSKVLDINITYNNNGYSIEGKMDCFDSLQSLIDHYKYNSLLVEEGEEAYISYSFSSTSFPVLSIGLRINELQKLSHNMIGKTGFWDEFEELQKDDIAFSHSRQKGSELENLHKNRYKNIVPFDHTLVTLRETDAYGSTYINASYVTGEASSSGSHYIATQGCLEGTADDFWSMVWQERTLVIILLTELVERGRNKCWRYWPESTVPGIEHGDLFITCLEESIYPHYTFRHFLVTSFDGEERNIFHFHLRGWIDHGVPRDTGIILDLITEVNTKMSELHSLNPGPLVVQCSDGIGRTGVYITIDVLIKLVVEKGWDKIIDIKHTVHHLRGQRTGMVQTDIQYKFIYEVLLHYINTRQQLFPDNSPLLSKSVKVSNTNAKLGASPLLQEFNDKLHSIEEI